MKSKHIWKKPAAILGVAITGVALAACDVEKTEEGEMPNVDVEGGQMPEYDVDAADVEVDTEEVEVEVPTIEVEEPDAGEPEE